MFDFSVFLMGPQNSNSRFHNLSYCIPVLTWDTSMNFLCNSLQFYTNITYLVKALNFVYIFCVGQARFCDIEFFIIKRV